VKLASKESQSLGMASATDGGAALAGWKLQRGVEPMEYREPYYKYTH
jgi:hypothetical protein